MEHQCGWLLWLWHMGTGRLSSLRITQCAPQFVEWLIWPADLELEEFRRLRTCVGDTHVQGQWAFCKCTVYIYQHGRFRPAHAWCVLLFSALSQAAIIFDCRQTHCKREHVLHIECSLLPHVLRYTSYNNYYGLHNYYGLRNCLQSNDMLSSFECWTENKNG
jgi:hypothetical protein